MKLTLIAHTPNIETMIATSMLTTTSGALPSTLYYRLQQKPGKVKDIVGRVEVQHGNILEHNRLVWELEATNNKVLDIMLKTKFLNITRLDESKWLVSGSLRSIIDYADKNKDEFSKKTIKTMKTVAPTIHSYMEARYR